MAPTRTRLSRFELNGDIMRPTLDPFWHRALVLTHVCFRLRALSSRLDGCLPSFVFIGTSSSDSTLESSDAPPGWSLLRYAFTAEMTLFLKVRFPL